MIINDNIEGRLYLGDYSECRLDHGHICIYDLYRDVDEDHLEKEWKQAVISLRGIRYLEPEYLNDMFGTQIGVHIIKERSNMDDIRFTNPLLQKEEHISMDMGDSDIQYMQQQRANSASLEPHVGLGTELLSCRPPPALNDIVKWHSNSKLICSTTTVTVQEVDLDSESTSSRLASDTSSEEGSDDDLWMCQKELLSLRPCWEEPLDSENWESNLLQSASTSDTVGDQGCGIASRKLQSTLKLDLNCEPNETFCHALAKVDSDSDSIMSCLASDTAIERVDRALLDHPENCPVESSQAPCFAGLVSTKTKNIGLMLDLNKEPTDTFYHASPKRGLVSDSIMSSLASDTAREDRAVLDHPENCPVESSLDPSFAEMQNIQMPCPTSISGIVSGEELHPETCWTMSPPTIDESLRNQVEQSQNEVEMESSVDAATHVLSHSHDHSATTAPSEEAIDALEEVQDFNTNVPFTCPNSLKNTNDFDVGNQLTLLDNGLCDQVPDMNQQQQLPFLNPSTPTSCKPVEYTEEDWHSAPPSLDDVYCSSNSDSVPQSLVASPVERPLHDAYNNPDSMQSAGAIDGSNDLPKKCIVLFLSLFKIIASLFGSAMWHWCFHHNYTLTGTKLDHAVVDHPAKAPREYSPAAGFAKTQITEAQGPILSSGKISGQEELHLNTMLPATTDASVRNQLEPNQDDLEMEAFYASLDADTYVTSRSHDHSATTTTCEAAKEALKIVQDFITNDPSFLLDPEQCSIMKTSLDYLSNLPANDGALSGETRALISEASRVFTHSSKDYIEASMKIESTASELLKADELEADLEDNKNQFKEVMASEKELLQKLAYLEESKKELEKHINAVKANISASQSEQSMTRKKKRDIFEEGKALKTQTSEFRKKVPHLQHEQDLAKETQAKIRAEWSELGEKLKKIVVE